MNATRGDKRFTYLLGLVILAALTSTHAMARPKWLPEIRPKWLSNEDWKDGGPAVTVKNGYQFAVAGENFWIDAAANVDATVAWHEEDNRDPIKGGVKGWYAWLGDPIAFDVSCDAEYETDQPFENQYLSAGVGLATLNVFSDESVLETLGYYLVPNVTALGDTVWPLASDEREAVGADEKEDFFRLSLELCWENYLDIIKLNHVRYEVRWVQYWELDAPREWRNEDLDNYRYFRAELMYDFSKNITWCDGFFVAYHRGQLPTYTEDEDRFEAGFRFFSDYEE